MIDVFHMIAQFLEEYVLLAGLGVVSLIFLAFFFLSVDLFNVRKEAVETNVRIAEMNRRMRGMNDGIKELVHYFIMASEDIKTMKDQKSFPVQDDNKAKASPSTLENHVIL